MATEMRWDMGIALQEMLDQPRRIQNIEVQRIGSKLIVPEKISYDAAIETLQRLKEDEESIVAFKEVVQTFPWDGAYAFTKAMEEMLGYCIAAPTPGFFGNKPPQRISIQTSTTKSILVPWGRFSLPQLEGGYMETSVSHSDGRVVFQINAECKKKYEKLIRDLAERTRELVQTHSIYKGKAVRIAFIEEALDETGRPVTRQADMPTPVFLELSKIDEDGLIFSDDVMAGIKNNLFTLIEHAETCRQHKIPLKRGILLAGKYGTGKTLAAYHTALKCTKNNWTFIYIRTAAELPHALRFANQYAPAVVFCEDIDRITSGERSENMDTILNTLDGVETKCSEIITVLTTNHLENITRAMLRPGRIDALINVLPPDDKAVEKLLRLYGRGLIDPTENLEQVGKELSGEIPAIIGEVVEKAKLAAIGLGDTGKKLTLTGETLYLAAIGMRGQRQALKTQVNKPATEAEQFGDSLGKVLANSLGKAWANGNGKQEEVTVNA